MEAGVTWAEQDTHSWELFNCRLHETFLRVLKARKQREDESGLLFPTHFRKEPRNTYPWHQIQLPQTKRRATPVPVLGPLPREWRWGPDLLPVVLSWLSELQWLDLPPAEERHPRAHWQVYFMELAIDFEAYAGRQLPPAPQSRFQGGDMSVQEKARVMRLITTLLGCSVGKESILPAKLTNSCKSLIPMGARAVMGLEGRPLLTKPLDVWKDLQQLQKYGEDRWAQRQRQRQALTERPDAQCLGQEHDLGDSRLSCRRPCLAPPEEVFFVLWDSFVAVPACSCGSEPPLVRPHRRPQGSRQGPL